MLPLRAFLPNFHAERLDDVTPGFLAQLGVRALILDLDNTLVPWHGKEVGAEVLAWLQAMRDAGVRLCIVSNTHRPRRLRELAGRLDVAYVTSGGKPRRRGFLQAMALMETATEETAVVGDQVLTDILGGNRCGLTTILVKPLTQTEFIGTRLVSRNVERVILRMLQTRGEQAEPVSRG